MRSNAVFYMCVPLISVKWFDSRNNANEGFNVTACFEVKDQLDQMWACDNSIIFIKIFYFFNVSVF